MRRVYLDHSATTPLDSAAFEAMRPYFLEKFGNASSIHREGQEAKAALDESRDRIARSVGATAGELIFVGSGTEADNFALKGILAAATRSGGKQHMITGNTEHQAVLETCRFLEDQGCSVSYMEVDGYGMVNPDDIRRAIR